MRAAVVLLAVLVPSFASGDTPADYEAAARDAFAREDCSAAFRIGQRFRVEHPDNAMGYWIQIGSAAMPPCKRPDSDADLADLAQAIRELRRRRLADWDKIAVTTTYQRTFEWRATLARKRGDFARAIAILDQLKALGDPRSRLAADIGLSFVHAEKYVQTNKRADAMAARDATQAALRNKAGLAAEGYDDHFLALLNAQIASIEYELGNQKAAVAAFEMAARLDPSDQFIADNLEAARSGDTRRWLSLRDILGILAGD